MQAQQIKGQGINGASTVDIGHFASDGAFAQLFSGQSMDVAALGLGKDLTQRTQHVGIVTAMLNRERDSTQRVIDSIAGT